MVSRLILAVVLAGFSGAACSDQAAKTNFKAEAKALCDAFNPATWGVDFQQKIQAAIHSEPMNNIYQGLVNDTPEKSYSNYTQKVSNLIGEQHTCPSIKNYFSFSTVAYAHEESRGSVMFTENIQKLINAKYSDSESTCYAPEAYVADDRL